MTVTAAAAREVTILGLGNELAGDDAVGPWIASALSAADLPGGIRVRNVGPDPLVVLQEIEAGRTVLVVDACRSGRPAGEIVVLRLDDLDGDAWTGSSPLSLHGFDLAATLRLGRALGLPLDRGWLFGIEAADIRPGAAPLRDVVARLPELTVAAQEVAVALAAGIPPAGTYEQGDGR